MRYYNQQDTDEYETRSYTFTKRLFDAFYAFKEKSMWYSLLDVTSGAPQGTHVLDFAGLVDQHEYEVEVRHYHAP